MKKGNKEGKFLSDYEMVKNATGDAGKPEARHVGCSEKKHIWDLPHLPHIYPTHTSHHTTPTPLIPYITLLLPHSHLTSPHTYSTPTLHHPATTPLIPHITLLLPTPT